MRAAALKSGTDLREGRRPGPGARVRHGARAGEGVRHLRQSDLHFAKHGAEMLALGKQMGGMPDHGRRAPSSTSSQDVYMGHEFCAEVLEVGPDTVGPAPGTLVTSIPVLLTMTGVQPIVYSNDVAGGYGERMLLSAPMLAEVPNGLDFRHAALTEPMAVGLHAVNKSAHHARRGRARARLRPGRPGGDRRAEAQGHRHHRRHRLLPGPPRARHHHGRHRGGRPGRRARLRRVDAGPAAASRSCASRPSACPGSSTRVLRDAPHSTRLVVVGVCMETDRINPFFGISKELNVQFCLGYDPMEFAGTLRVDRRGRARRGPADHRRGRPRRRRRRVRGARPTPTSTARSW